MMDNHVLQSEYALLSALLKNNEEFDKVSHFLRPEHFSTVLGQKVYQAISGAISSGANCDHITVFSEIMRKQPDSDITIEEIASISRSDSYKSMVKGYASNIVENHKKGKLLNSIQKSYELAADDSISLEDRVSQILALIDGDACKSVEKRDPVKLSELLPAYLDKLQRNADGVGVDYIPTGFDKLDELLGGGMRPGKVYVLAARPSVGKSAVAQTICESSAKHGKPSALFSQEMTNEEMVDRAISRIGGVSMGFHNRAINNEQDFSLAMEAVEAATNMPIWLFDGAGLRLSDIASRARQLKRKHGLAMLAIDYLQLCQSVNPKLSRHHQIEELSRGIKKLAKELGIPILLLSQLNREVEKRNPPRPITADLKESGAIEEDADVIILMWTHKEGETALLGFDVAKNRGGAKGSFGVSFAKKYQQFYETDQSINAEVVKKENKYEF